MRNTKRLPVSNPVIERIEQLLLAQKKSKKELLQYIGIGESAFTRWKYDNGKSYIKYMPEIATFLGTTVEYLLNGCESDNKTTLTSDEMKLVEIFRKLDSEKKQLLISLSLAIQPTE